MYGTDSLNLDITLTNLDCTGTEKSLLSCQFNIHSKALRTCESSEIAGVRCGGNYKDITIRDNYA